ncbi:MAG: hypothetical protein U0235_32585 [Polyangiaceae bacterium]
MPRTVATHVDDVEPHVNDASGHAQDDVAHDTSTAHDGIVSTEIDLETGNTSSRTSRTVPPSWRITTGTCLGFTEPHTDPGTTDVHDGATTGLARRMTPKRSRRPVRRRQRRPAHRPARRTSRRRSFSQVGDCYILAALNLAGASRPANLVSANPNGTYDVVVFDGGGGAHIVTVMPTTTPHAGTGVGPLDEATAMQIWEQGAAKFWTPAPTARLARSTTTPRSRMAVTRKWGLRS